jgi:two-component system sensor histidine kinase KdpD
VVETYGRKGVVELLQQLEIIPRKKLEYKGTIFEEMDVDAILARKPQVVLVDELAHTNVVGSKHAKRFEDVLEILSCLSWKWRKRSSAKIAKRTYEERAQALHC